jgi:peptide/nickel transport system substrate-binding protein
LLGFFEKITSFLRVTFNIESNPQERSNLLKKAQQLISEDYVNGYLFELAFPTVANAKIIGLWENAPTQATDLTNVKWAD